MEKKVFVTKELIDDIVKDYPTPFHIYDEKGHPGEREGFERGDFPGTGDIRSFLQ